ncbi:MAG: serine hydrolase [Ferruginibacter sp.]
MQQCFRGILPLLAMALFMAGCVASGNISGTTNQSPSMSWIPGKINEDSGRTDAFMEGLMKKYPQYFDSVLNHRNDWNVQIIYTKVDRGANGIPALHNYYFNVDPSRYFYPASTVKFPVSLLALQRLNELKEKGINKYSSMITETAFSGQTAVYNDPNTPDGKPTIANYIKKILMVSDNDAYNRLYEFLGQQYINDELHKKGFEDVQLLHRLQISLSEEENRHTNPVKFLDSAGKIIYDQPAQYNAQQYAMRRDALGTSYYSGSKLVNEPMNFSKKNRISLEDLHNILIGLVFPNKVHANERFNLTEDDRRFVFKNMSQFPQESAWPSYDSSYHDAYCKFILFGSDTAARIKNIRSFNKPGDAYGQMLDVAYIVDYDKKIEFFLSAVIYCNSDGIINDDKYDYKTIGLPFMKHIGEAVYDYELSRERKIIPDFSNFKFQYDK